ncbi:MAG: hypothetical protein LQ344_001405 [Seirophora lacunosa]|nr:MAG: hypothetical protein LQ344_001405 [Seirophora lacunosa]
MQATIPTLYKAPIFRVFGAYGVRRLHGFVAVLLRHPERVPYVRRLRIAGLLLDKPLKFARLEDQDLNLAGQILLPERFTWAENMLEALASDAGSNFDATIALLIIILRHLQAARFSLVAGSSQVLFYLPAVLADLLQPRSREPPDRLYALQDIDYFSTSKRPGIDPIQPFSDLLLLFRLPRIRSIQIMSVEDEANFNMPILPHYQPSLTTLILRKSWMRLGTLQLLLQSTPHLQTLEYDYLADLESPLTPPEAPVMDCPALRRVLDQVSASLESLTLSIAWKRGYASPCDISGSLGPMTHFTKLKYLQAPMILMAGRDPPLYSVLDHQLPEQLREFCCSNGLCSHHTLGWEAPDTLRQMLPLIQNDSRSLQKLLLDAKEGPYLWWEHVRRPIKAACEEIGISYEVIKGSEEF